MKKIISGIIILVFGLMAAQTTQAQGTTYLSNLGQLSAGSDPVGSNSWLLAEFGTGTNAKGYSLNSIQLAMTDASGNPSDFTVMLYQYLIGASFPGSSIGSLNGSSNPATSGIYTYTPASNVTLSPNAYYDIVFTAGTAVVNGAYELSYAGADSYNPSGGWESPFGANGFFISSNKSLSWNSTSGFPQFAINATVIPEPSELALGALGALLLNFRCEKRPRHKHL